MTQGFGDFLLSWELAGALTVTSVLVWVLVGAVVKVLAV